MYEPSSSSVYEPSSIPSVDDSVDTFQIRLENEKDVQTNSTQINNQTQLTEQINQQNYHLLHILWLLIPVFMLYYRFKTTHINKICPINKQPENVEVINVFYNVNKTRRSSSLPPRKKAKIKTLRRTKSDIDLLHIKPKIYYRRESVIPNEPRQLYTKIDVKPEKKLYVI